MHEFHTQRRVEFADTDMGGICHFSRYVVFMETAEHQLLEALGTSVHVPAEGDRRPIGWPRVSVQIDYKSPARFGDTIDILVQILRKGTKSITYGFTLSVEGRELATGKMTAVCCEHGEDFSSLKAVPIPSIIADQIEEVPQ